jgi:hypothetical protein
MTATLRKAGLFLFTVIAFGVVAWNLIPQDGPAPPAPADVAPTYAAPPAPPAPSPVVPTGGDPARSATLGPGSRDYAIALPELRGLPQDASPGTRLEVWVTWDRPVTRSPKVQRLLPEASLVRIIPPTTPEGVPAAVLRVPNSSMSDLLYADGYGALSATVLS